MERKSVSRVSTQHLGKRGFTLIELLIVIVIIIILAAILFPVFAKARDRARLTACVNNVRQMGIAMRQYLDDYDNLFPCVNTPEARAVNDGYGLLYNGEAAPGDNAQVNYVKNYSFFTQIEPYLKSKKVRICYGDTRNVEPEPTAGKMYSSYGYRFFVSLTFAPEVVDHDPWFRHPGQSFKLKWFFDPSKTFVINELGYWKGGCQYVFHSHSPLYDPTGGGITDRRCAINVVFADCHSEYIRLGKLMEGMPNTFYDYHWWNQWIPNNSNLDIPGYRDIP